MSKESNFFTPTLRDPDEERKEDKTNLGKIEDDARCLLGVGYDGSGIEHIIAQNRGLLEVEEENHRNASPPPG